MILTRVAGMLTTPTKARKPRKIEKSRLIAASQFVKHTGYKLIGLNIQFGCRPPEDEAKGRPQKFGSDFEGG